MLCSRTTILIAGAALLVVTLGVSVLLASGDERDTLASRLLGSGPDDEARPTTRADGDAGAPGAPGGDARTTPAGRDDDAGDPGTPPGDDAFAARGEPNEAELPFVGRWVERSAGAGRTVTVDLTLTDDLAYVATATVVDERAPDEPLRVSSAGSWALRDGSVMLLRETSDRPDALAPGAIDVYWNSAIGDDGGWTYEDSEGLTRTLRRLAEPAPEGGPGPTGVADAPR